jgi:uncharacterized protein (TIGR02611 family)
MHSFKELLRFIWRSTKRIVVFVVGVALVAVGLAMLVLPGPGLLVIILGLIVLATEFVWAEVMLDKARARAKQAGGAAKQGLSRLRRKKADAPDPTA